MSEQHPCPDACGGLVSPDESGDWNCDSCEWTSGGEQIAMRRVDEITAAEALYGFMGWLTSRETVTPELSAKHNAAIAAELVDKFCKANELRDPRDGWEKTLKHPAD